MESTKDADFNSESIDDSNGTLSAIHRADNTLLQKLGYKSEFKRELSLLETISFSLAIMAVSCGHFAMVWGWFIPCIFITCIAASMAELASSMPTSAGLYYFSAKMASEKRSALASWITGWSNITGQVTLICSIDYSCAELITTGIAMATDGAVALGSGATYGTLLAIHLTQTILCSAGTRVLARMTVLVLVVIMGTTLSGIISLLVCSRGMVSPKDAFTKFENHTGWSNNVWAFILSFTTPMWCLTGSHAAPIAIMVGVLGTEILGWLMYIAVSFATYSVPDVLQSQFALTLGEVFLNVLGKKGALALWWSIAVLQYLCGCSQTVDASRVVFAFSRDDALPGSRWWKRVNRYTQTPVNAVWFVILLSVICGLLSFSVAAFDSIASCVSPHFAPCCLTHASLTVPRRDLGRWSRPIGAIAVAWVAFMVVMLLFPYSQTVGPQTTNYAVVIIMTVFLFATGSWIFSARHWFTGPVPNVARDSESSSSDFESTLR
ncbi:Amino acid/polyamine transporter I [Tylopilus felleus]